MKKFLPFMTGFYTTAPGMIPLSKGDSQNVFDINDSYSKYFQNKVSARSENLSKYYCEANLKSPTKAAVDHLLLTRLAQELPGNFEITDSKVVNMITNSAIDLANPVGYTSAFDAICSQLQEDVAVVQLDGDRDYLTAIHLCSPNHWDPRTKIGKPFNEIHTPVPHIERTVKNYSVMLNMVIDKGPFTRFAWGVSTDDRLNHHPEPPPGVDPNEWHGRKVVDDSTEFFVRVERQSLIGLKEVNAFIFTIRTYFYRVDELTFDEKQRLVLAINSMTKESLEYKGMLGFKDVLISKLGSV